MKAELWLTSATHFYGHKKADPSWAKHAVAVWIECPLLLGDDGLSQDKSFIG
jgi:hypothetical protein